jgi:hypothetical protein
MLQEMNLTGLQTLNLKDAVYKIAEAQSLIEELTLEMRAEKKWCGLDDMYAIKENLNELCKPVAGGVGCFLEEL